MNVLSKSPGRTLAGKASFALSLLLLQGGCINRPENPFQDQARTVSRIRIQVVNLNYNDVTLHARRGGDRQRLGILTGKTEQSYTMDWDRTLPLQIEVDMLAGGRCTTPPLVIDPGQTVQFQIDVQFQNGYCQQLRTR